tara:strand:- start:922 stop:1410 length:489 start_codon:yes stop_codon:yes gene_type:complete
MKTIHTLEDVRGDNFKVIIKHWDKRIGLQYRHESRQAFLETIWEMSLTAFDKPREVQVVIDAGDRLYISVGSPGFVSFGGQEAQLNGMKFPLKEWIHTHPFGEAYFSSRDMTTIGMYAKYLDTATVLGDGEIMTMHMFIGPHKEHYQEYSQWVWVNSSEEEE